MTQLTALKELAEKVEADNWRWEVRLAAALPVEAYDAFHGSLDAAKALHEAVLPDTTYVICPDYVYVGGKQCKGDPARAWLLAIIRAKISELET